VIGCNQYYQDSDACYAQWLKTPSIVEPRCLPSAPNASQSDFGSPARIPETVKVFFERHPDIDGQQQATHPQVEYVLVYMLTCWTPQMGIRPICGRWYDTPALCKFAAQLVKGKTRCVPRKAYRPAIYTHPEASRKAERHRLPDKIYAQQQAARSRAMAQPATRQTGYVVQLATFRSEDEAAGEFRRLRFQNPMIVGALQQRIQRAELGASGVFYRLGLGPLSTKDQAHGLCKSLIAAGEKVCWVRLLSEKSETAPPLVNVQQPAGERAAQLQRQKAYRRAAATRAARAKQTRATPTRAARAAQRRPTRIVPAASGWSSSMHSWWRGESTPAGAGQGTEAD
jgi:hypothetical protein